MTKRDLIIRISNETGLVQEDVRVVIQKTLDYIVETLSKGDRIEFRDFGIFDVYTRKARIGRNPNKPENTVRIPARKIVRFKPGKIMKSKVAKS